MNVILNRSLVVVMLVHSLPLIAQDRTTAETPSLMLRSVIKQSDSSIEDSKTHFTSEKKKRLEKIQQQLQQLTLLWEEMQQRKNQESLPLSATPPPMPEFSPKSNDVPDPPRPNPPLENTAPENISSEAIEPLPPTSPSHLKTPSPQTEPEPQDKETGPIDRFALSSSLFATGHFKECLHVLNALDKSQWTSHESHWAQFLEASCYRKLKHPEEAQRRYRRLVAEKDSAWVGTLSRWWLDEIQERNNLQQDVKTLTGALQLWRVEVDELTQKNN